MNTIAFSYDKENNTASCIISYNGMEFVGLATCHPEDLDFASERTGCAIAESRAKVKMWKYIKNGELAPILKTFKHLMSCMKNSKHFNPSSYEAKMIRSQIKQIENKIGETNVRIQLEKDFLKNYIKSKDDFYKKIRKGRT